MASIPIENGKRIQDLLQISRVSDDSLLLVSDNNLTRNITIKTLRQSFNGDTATSGLNNLYYSVEKINEIVNSINSNIASTNKSITFLTNHVNDLEESFGADLSKLENDMAAMRSESRQADTVLDTKIANLESSINTSMQEIEEGIIERIDTAETNLTNEVNDAEKNIIDKITQSTNTVTDAIAGAKDSIVSEINEAETNLGSKITQSTNTVTTAINNAKDSIVSEINETETNLGSKIDNSTSTVTTAINSAKTDIVNQTENLISQSQSEITSSITDVKNEINSHVDSSITKIENTIIENGGMDEGVKDSLTQIQDTVSGNSSALSDVNRGITTLESAIDSFGALLSQVSDNINDMQNSSSSIGGGGYPMYMPGDSIKTVINAVGNVIYYGTYLYIKTGVQFSEYAYIISTSSTGSMICSVTKSTGSNSTVPNAMIPVEATLTNLQIVDYRTGVIRASVSVKGSSSSTAADTFGPIAQGAVYLSFTLSTLDQYINTYGLKAGATAEITLSNHTITILKKHAITLKLDPTDSSKPRTSEVVMYIGVIDVTLNKPISYNTCVTFTGKNTYAHNGVPLNDTGAGTPASYCTLYPISHNSSGNISIIDNISGKIRIPIIGSTENTFSGTNAYFGTTNKLTFTIHDTTSEYRQGDTSIPVAFTLSDTSSNITDILTVEDFSHLGDNGINAYIYLQSVTIRMGRKIADDVSTVSIDGSKSAISFKLTDVGQGTGSNPTTFNSLLNYYRYSTIDILDRDTGTIKLTFSEDHYPKLGTRYMDSLYTIDESYKYALCVFTFTFS